MATVEQIVKESLEDYPSLYQNRLDVLAHIFGCGSGYETIDGEMATPYDRPVRTDEDLFLGEPINEYPEVEALRSFHEERCLAADAENARRRFLIENAERFARVKYSKHAGYRSTKEIFRLTRVPYISHLVGREPLDDITELNQEWRDALEELCWATLQAWDHMEDVKTGQEQNPVYFADQLAAAAEIIQVLSGETPEERAVAQKDRRKQLARLVVDALKGR